MCRSLTISQLSLAVFWGLFIPLELRANTACVATEHGWRHPEQDAVNCTFVFLTCHGVDVPYAEIDKYFQSLGHSPNLLDIKKFIESCGKSVDVIRCAPSEELFQHTPAIIVLQHERDDGASMALLVERSEDSVSLLHGGIAKADRMSWDLFLRSWTGIAIIETPSRPRAVRRRVLLSVLALSVIAVSVLFKAWRNSNA